MKSRRAPLVALALLLLALFGIFFPADDAQIYSAIFRKLVSVDDTYGGGLHPQRVYVSIELVDQFPPFRVAPPRTFGNLNERHMASIAETASDLGIALSWVESRRNLQFEENSEIVGGGVLIEFSEIEHFIVFARASGSIHIANLAAGGARYDFLKVFVFWKHLFKSGKWVS
jgi:hypothetical protein